MASHSEDDANAKAQAELADVENEFGPFPGASAVHGVTFDGANVWLATGRTLRAIDPKSGECTGSLDTPCDAGTAFDGTHIYQLAAGRIQKLDPRDGRVLTVITAPGKPGDQAGLTWAEGCLWLALHRERKIVQLDPNTGAILRTLTSDRFVTGVTFADGALWHGTWENDESELRELDPEHGNVRTRLALKPGHVISGLEWDGGERFFCGGGPSGRVRVVRKQKQPAKAAGTPARAARESKKQV